MGGAARYWAVAVSILVHVVAIGLMIVQFQPEKSGAQAAGLGGIEISMGPMGGAPGGAATPVAPELLKPEMIEPTMAAEVQPVIEEQVAEAPDDMPVPIETESVEAVEPPVEQVPVAEPVETVTQPIETVEAVAEDAAEVVAARPVEPVEPAPQPAQKPTPPKPMPERAEVEPQPDPAPKPAPAPKQTAAVPPGAQGKAGSESKPDAAGSGDATQGGGMPGSSADYLALLQAWLERHKEYPRRAQIRRQEGTALLRFVVDRNGHVLSHQLERSSGYAVLDRAVEEMIERAEPLPAMPADMSRDRLELVVPVQFFLR